MKKKESCWVFLISFFFCFCCSWKITTVTFLCFETKFIQRFSSFTFAARMMAYCYLLPFVYTIFCWSLCFVSHSFTYLVIMEDTAKNFLTLFYIGTIILYSVLFIFSMVHSVNCRLFFFTTVLQP